MLLAYVERRHPAQLRADFQQFYGLNIDRMGDDYTFLHAAILASQLPRESRIARELDPDSAWRDETVMLASIEHAARVLAWQNTKDGQHGRNFPEPIRRPSERKAEQERMNDYDKDFVNRILGEVKDG